MKGYKKEFVDRFIDVNSWFLSLCSNNSSVEGFVEEIYLDSDLDEVLDDLGYLVECEKDLERRFEIKSLISEYFSLFKKDEIKFLILSGEYNMELELNGLKYENVKFIGLENGEIGVLFYN